MTELQKTNALLRDLIRVIYIQHQQLIWALSPDRRGAWLNRFALGYTLQTRHKIWSDKEWALILNEDLPGAFRHWPDLAKTWGVLKKYYPADVRKFMTGVIATAKENQKGHRAKKNHKK